MSIACVVLNYNDANTTIDMVKRILDYRSINHIIIVDNNSTDNSADILKEVFKDTKKVTFLISDYNGGYGSGNNIGILFAVNEFKSEYVLIANPDVIFSETCVTKLALVLEKDKSVGVVSAVQKNIHGNIVENFAWNLMTKNQFTLSFSRFFWGMTKKLSVRPKDIMTAKLIDVDCVGGAMLMLRKEMVDVHGVYDPSIFLYCEETVLAKKVKQKKYSTKVLCEESYIHNHSVTINKTFRSKSKKRQLMRESGYVVLKDYYNASNAYLLFVRAFFAWCKLETLIIDFIDYVLKRR